MGQEPAAAPTMTETARRTFSRAEVEKLSASFAEQGYLVFRDLVSKDKLAELSAKVFEAYEQQKRSGALFFGGGTMAGHLNCYPGQHCRFAYEALEEQGIVELVHAILPKAAAGPLRPALNFNLPKSVAQNYHIDGYFHDAFMILNIAVVDTDVINGAIELSPGSHKRPYKYWQFAVAPLRGTRIVMKRGDVLLRPSNLWHRGMPNRSSVPRPMLGFTMGEKGKTYDDPFRVDGGGITFSPNRFRTDWVGRIRERSYVAVPFAHHAARFVMSLVANKG
jgi:ectoine hydroxylase-related dioxygenase (phytanoyl-CoA dioxygenase family)